MRFVITTGHADATVDRAIRDRLAELKDWANKAFGSGLVSIKETGHVCGAQWHHRAIPYEPHSMGGGNARPAVPEHTDVCIRDPDHTTYAELFHGDDAGFDRPKTGPLSPHITLNEKGEIAACWSDKDIS